MGSLFVLLLLLVHTYALEESPAHQGEQASSMHLQQCLHCRPSDVRPTRNDRESRNATTSCQPSFRSECTGCGTKRGRRVPRRMTRMLRLWSRERRVMQGATVNYRCRFYSKILSSRNEIIEMCLAKAASGLLSLNGVQLRLVHVTVVKDDGNGAVNVLLHLGRIRKDNSSESFSTFGRPERRWLSEMTAALALCLFITVAGVCWHCRKSMIHAGASPARNWQTFMAVLGDSERAQSTQKPISFIESSASQELSDASVPPESHPIPATPVPSHGISADDDTPICDDASAPSDRKRDESSLPLETATAEAGNGEHGHVDKTDLSPSGLGADNSESTVQSVSTPEPESEASTSASCARSSEPETPPQSASLVTQRSVADFEPGACMRRLHCEEIARIFRRAVSPLLEGHVSRGDLSKQAAAELLERHVRETRDVADQWMGRWQRGAHEAVALSDVWRALMSMRKAEFRQEMERIVSQARGKA